MHIDVINPKMVSSKNGKTINYIVLSLSSSQQELLAVQNLSNGVCAVTAVSNRISVLLVGEFIKI